MTDFGAAMPARPEPRLPRPLTLTITDEDGVRRVLRDVEFPGEVADYKKTGERFEVTRDGATYEVRISVGITRTA